MFSIDPLLVYIVTLSLAATVSAFAADFFKLPSVITHILVGVLIGPFALGLVGDKEVIQRLGEFGIILLLFFIGMEISLRHIAEHWRIITLATLLHSLVSIGIIILFGWFLAWPIGRSVILGMVISLSSTAVLLRYFEERKTLNTKLGREVTGILILQDLMVIPMLLVITALAPDRNISVFVEQTIASIFVLAIVLMLANVAIKTSRQTRIAEKVGRVVQNAEAGLFVGISMCFGFALLTTSLNLSPGFGAFLAGLIFANLNMPEKTRKRIVPFKIFFMALFFMSIGLLIDIPFLFESLWIVLFFVIIIFALNTVIRSVYFRSMGETWQYSFYASSLLAHVGEFSFFIAAAGYSSGIITNYSYQITIIMIATSILLSPLWIRAFSQIRPEGCE